MPMHPPLNVVLLGFSLILLGCSPSASSVSPAPVTQPIAPETTLTLAQIPQSGQMLPITAQAKIGDHWIDLEVAQTPEEQEIGLMFRDHVADDRGMLFPFDPPRLVTFWMKNVSIPLDMVFLHKGKVTAIAAEAAPCTADPCPLYGPKGFVDQVIELRSGRAAELGIQVGDRILVEPKTQN